MELVLAVASQATVMFLLMAIGFLCFKLDILNESVASHLSEVLLYAVTPAVVLHAFQVDYDRALASKLLVMTAIAVGSQLLSIVMARLLIRRNKADASDRTYLTERFSAVFSNCGYMGLPLASAALGDMGVLYSSVFVAVFNVFLWTHGVSSMSGARVTRKSVIKVLCSTPIISVALGLVLFLTSWRLPGVLNDTVGYVADLNTPLAMFVAGTYIARNRLLDIFISVRLYAVSAVRLLLIPALLAVFLMFFPFDQGIAVAAILLVSCPSAATTTLFADKYNANPGQGSRLVALSTLLSIATIPLMVTISTFTRGLLAVF